MSEQSKQTKIPNFLLQLQFKDPGINFSELTLKECYKGYKLCLESSAWGNHPNNDCKVTMAILSIDDLIALRDKLSRVIEFRK